MPRSNSSVPRHRRHRKIVKLAKGYFGARSRNFKAAKDAVTKAGLYAYRDRRQKKRQFRRLWIVRISAASKAVGTSYSRFMGALKQKGSTLNRKMLAEIAARDFEGFKAIEQCLK